MRFQKREGDLSRLLKQGTDRGDKGPPSSLDSKGTRISEVDRWDACSDNICNLCCPTSKYSSWDRNPS
ncbi:hypothetical protein TNCV_4828291 [Trichonephila clavipes]|uniref:Uncharacterized protein n=1 Tax=Trichonephila clavipes TaxID=2585209 RepID=A0A8X6SM19_TRICX|nr:hypothetical protein TNCV_4828291 [Trichonephila clavipes]